MWFPRMTNKTIVIHTFENIYEMVLSRFVYIGIYKNIYSELDIYIYIYSEPYLLLHILTNFSFRIILKHCEGE